MSTMFLPNNLRSWPTTRLSLLFTFGLTIGKPPRRTISCCGTPASSFVPNLGLTGRVFVSCVEARSMCHCDISGSGLLHAMQRKAADPTSVPPAFPIFLRSSASRFSSSGFVMTDLPAARNLSTSAMISLSRLSIHSLSALARTVASNSPIWAAWASFASWNCVTSSWTCASRRSCSCLSLAASSSVTFFKSSPPTLVLKRSAS